MTDLTTPPASPEAIEPGPHHGRGPGRPGRASGPWRRSLARVLSVVVLLAVWWAVSAAGVWSDLVLPSPGAVRDAFVQSVTSDGPRRGLSGYLLWEHLSASLGRIGRGMVWAVVVGVPLGLLLASVQAVRVLVEPYVSFLRSLPPLGYFSLLIIWFGIDDTSKVWLLFLAAFPPITLATISGVERVRPEYVEAARTLGAGRWQVVRVAVLPSIVPDVLTGVRLALGFAWTTIVAAETSNGIPGIGGLAWATKKELRADVAVMCVIVIGLTALALDNAVRLLERRLAPWKGRA